MPHQSALDSKSESVLLIAVAPYLEDFLAELFGVRAPLAEQAAQHEALTPLYSCKRLFVQRQALRAHKPQEVADLDPAPIEAELERRISAPLSDLAFARAVLAWMDAESVHKDDLALAARYAAWATLTPAGHRRWRDSVLFRMPHKIDPMHLIDLRTSSMPASDVGLPEERRRHREGFALTETEPISHMRSTRRTTASSAITREGLLLARV